MKKFIGLKTGDKKKKKWEGGLRKFIGLDLDNKRKVRPAKKKKKKKKRGGRGVD